MATEIKGARDALEKILWCLNWMYENTGDQPTKDHLVKPIELANAALVAPPRQCDVGSAKEQEDRFNKYCRGSNYCAVCPIRKLWDFRDGHSPSCTILWSQMPYEAEQRGGAE